MTSFPLHILLLVFLVFSSIAVAIVKNLVAVVFIYSAFSLVSTIIWVLLQAPDLAITEAAVGAGASTILFLLVLRNVGVLKWKDTEDKA